MRKYIIITLALIAVAPTRQALSQSKKAPVIRAFFAPPNGGLIVDTIVNVIRHAKHQILVQSYYFTQMDICHEIDSVRRHKNVQVKILKDRRDKGDCVEKLIHGKHVSVMDDDVRGIQHNKVIIVDSKIVMTGSFNWTNDAENNNAENLLIINDRPLAKQYIENWWSRYDKSTKSE